MLKYSEASLDGIFRALGDPTRRALVETLSRGPASVSALAEPLEMTLAAVVQHLQVLEACGLVKTQKTGRVRTCTLEHAALNTAADWIKDRRSERERQLDALGDFLDQPDHPAAPSNPKRKKS